MQSEKSNTQNRELLLTRVLNAPIELVWEVWTKPEHIAEWWGPNGFTNTITKMDVTPKGEWHLIMHGPDGTNYKNKSIFKEVVSTRKLFMNMFQLRNLLQQLNLKRRAIKPF